MIASTQRASNYLCIRDKQVAKGEQLEFGDYLGTHRKYQGLRRHGVRHRARLEGTTLNEYIDLRFIEAKRDVAGNIQGKESNLVEFTN